MEEGIEKNENNEKIVREEIFSKAVRAGRRTYFFDVKATRKNDYYLTITESKKRFSKEGRPFFEKHKIFLYKEDFEKFNEGLNEVIEFINREQPKVQREEADTPVAEAEVEESATEDFTNVDFEDLEDKKK